MEEALKEPLDEPHDRHTGVPIGKRVVGKTLVSMLPGPLHHFVEQCAGNSAAAVFAQNAALGAIEREPVFSIAHLETDRCVAHGSEENQDILAVERVDDSLLLENGDVETMDRLDFSHFHFVDPELSAESLLNEGRHVVERMVGELHARSAPH